MAGSDSVCLNSATKVAKHCLKLEARKNWDFGDVHSQVRASRFAAILLMESDTMLESTARADLLTNRNLTFRPSRFDFRLSNSNRDFFSGFLLAWQRLSSICKAKPNFVTLLKNLGEFTTTTIEKRKIH